MSRIPPSGISPTTTSTQSGKTKRGHAKGLGDDVHLPIDVVSPEGRPLEPKKNANKFIHQCGVVVRDNVPISIQEWLKQKDETVSYVSNRMKEVLWNKVICHFTLPVFDTPEATKACSDAVQHYSLKKMAGQFNNYKKRLYA